MTLASPVDFRVTLIRLFPEFASKSDETDTGTYHQVAIGTCSAFEALP